MEIPLKIGKYTILQKLGEGASGCVAKAEQDIIHRIVAIKILFPELVQQNPLVVKRFKREARLASSLLHPYIVPIFEIDECKGMHYYTMQYISGTPMLDYVKNDGLKFQERVDIFLKLCEAIALAHSKNIVHRDLKPHNVIITKENHPVILDFGIAKSLQDEDQMTRVGNILGSAHYMAPEQAMTGGIGAYTDIFALGVMMYEFMTSTRPFQGASVRDLVLKRIEYAKNPEVHRPLSMCAIKPDIPEELNDIVFRCLSATPAGRYPDAGQLLIALQNFNCRNNASHTSKITRLLTRSIHKTKSYLLPSVISIILMLAIISLGVIAQKSDYTQLTKVREFQKVVKERLNDVWNDLKKNR